MRVLVTGGAGFIGSYLVPRLLDRGDEVVVFDMAAEPKALSPVMGRIGYLRGDLGSGSDLYRAMMACRPEGVFHLGAILAGPCEENPVRGFQVNFGSTQALLDAASALKTKKFFMVSSISVFGRDAAEPVQDDAPKNPETIYGQTKLASEHLLSWYARKHGMDTCALRFTWVFGPGRTTGITALYSSLILDSIARGEAIVVAEPGGARRLALCQGCGQSDPDGVGPDGADATHLQIAGGPVGVGPARLETAHLQHLRRGAFHPRCCGHCPAPSTAIKGDPERRRPKPFPLPRRV